MNSSSSSTFADRSNAFRLRLEDVALGDCFLRPFMLLARPGCCDCLLRRLSFDVSNKTFKKWVAQFAGPSELSCEISLLWNHTYFSSQSERVRQFSINCWSMDSSVRSTSVWPILLLWTDVTSCTYELCKTYIVDQG
jgi:hypothetical protein